MWYKENKKICVDFGQHSTQCNMFILLTSRISIILYKVSIMNKMFQLEKNPSESLKKLIAFDISFEMTFEVSSWAM